MKTNLSNSGFVLRLAAVFVGSLVFWNAVVYMSQHTHYRIGLDIKQPKCSDFYVYGYHVERPAKLTVGDYVVFTSTEFDALYPHGYHITKQIAAVPGDVVRIKDDVLYINGKYIDKLWLRQEINQRPGYYDRQYTVEPGHYFVMGRLPRSYDSRYWGTVAYEAITGTATPIF